jgi:uncharacterized protein YndB with AHSA1/START domain
MTPERIEKEALLHAPRARVWRALTDVREFNRWFGVELSGSFAPGARLRGPVKQPGYEDLMLEIEVDRVEPERLVEWRWHPSALEPGRNYSTEEPTRVVFELEDAAGGTLLTVSESGFDRLPEDRQVAAYNDNEQGWTMQLDSIRRHLSKAAA